MKTQQSNLRIITISFIGNALEFYDFTLYGVFAMKMGQVFFPMADPLASLLASLAAFASGFLMRPIGAILFGHIGDKFGRKTALTVSIIGIGFPTVTIGLTPSYAEIGILAPIIVVASRLIQGICTGGEYNGAAIYCLEELQNKRPGFFSSFLTSAAVFGAIIATFLGGYFGKQEWEDAWRVPFVLGFFVSFVGLWFRSKISESREFQDQSISRKPIPMIAMLKDYSASSIKTFTAGAMNGIMSYTNFAFLTIFLSLYGSLPKDLNIVYLNLVGLFCYMCANPLMGHLYDKIGESKYITRMTILLCTVPFAAFILLSQPSLLSVVLAQALLGTCTASIGGVALAISQKQFPTLIRYRGVAFNFSLGTGLAGGTVGITHLYLIEKTGLIYMPSVYIAIVAILMYFLFSSLKSSVVK